MLKKRYRLVREERVNYEPLWFVEGREWWFPFWGFVPGTTCFERATAVTYLQRLRAGIQQKTLTVEAE